MQSLENNDQDNFLFEQCTSFLFPIFIQNMTNVPMYYTHLNIPLGKAINCIHQVSKVNGPMYIVDFVLPHSISFSFYTKSKVYKASTLKIERVHLVSQCEYKHILSIQRFNTNTGCAYMYMLCIAKNMWKRRWLGKKDLHCYELGVTQWCSFMKFTCVFPWFFQSSSS